MSAQHTPGPWQDDNDREYTVRRVIRRNGVIVATISEPTAGLSVDEVEANAWLIAAAPEMLEALTRIAAGRCGNNAVYNSDCPTEGELPERWCFSCIARAAIAKAEGKCEYCGVSGNTPHRSGCHYEGDDLEAP